MVLRYLCKTLHHVSEYQIALILFEPGWTRSKDDRIRFWDSDVPSKENVNLLKGTLKHQTPNPENLPILLILIQIIIHENPQF